MSVVLGSSSRKYNDRALLLEYGGKVCELRGDIGLRRDTGRERSNRDPAVGACRSATVDLALAGLLLKTDFIKNCRWLPSVCGATRAHFQPINTGLPASHFWRNNRRRYSPLRESEFGQL